MFRTHRFRTALVAGILCMLCAGARGELISHWTFDGTLEDAGPGGNDGVFFNGAFPDEPTYVHGYDGTPEGAIWLDGIGGYVRVMYGSGLPAYGNPAFTVAMWVKGPSGQQDKRVFSESSSTHGNPLFTIGTDGTVDDGLGGAVDLLIRGETTPINHRQSEMAAFDDTWHHIAYVDAGGAAALYVDGLRQTTNLTYARPTFFSK